MQAAFLATGVVVLPSALLIYATSSKRNALSKLRHTAYAFRANYGHADAISMWLHSLCNHAMAKVVVSHPKLQAIVDACLHDAIWVQRASHVLVQLLRIVEQWSPSGREAEEIEKDAASGEHVSTHTQAHLLKVVMN